MLPAHIIEELRRREREKERRRELFLDLPVEEPLVDPDEERRQPNGEGDEDTDRGVAVVDFVI